MRRALVAAYLAFACTAAAADDTPADINQFASDLGAILGSEKLCDLTIDADAVAKIVAARVPPSNMSFSTTLNSMIGLTTLTTNGITSAQKAAHCTAVRQSADFLGILAR